jgi:arabinogalactan oligomer/maltooligosaccharide transport system permease protein
MEKKDAVVTVSSPDKKPGFRPTEPMPAHLYYWQAFCGGLVSLLFVIVGFLWSLVVAFANIFVSIYKGLVSSYSILKRFLADLGHKFRYNDWSGRLSFFFFGTSNFAHGSYTNGSLFLLFEIGYLSLFSLFGASSIYMLGTLGTLGPTKVCSPQGFVTVCTTIPGDNSLLILIQGILWVLSLIIFFFIWHKSVDSGYKNYRISHFQDFNDRVELVKPYSAEIDEDISANKLYSFGFRKLKNRYSLVYQELGKNAVTRMDKAYSSFILDSTITANFVFHKKMGKFEKNLAKFQAKIAKLKGNAKYLAKDAELQKKYDEINALYSEADANYQNFRLSMVPGEESKAKLEALGKVRRKARIKALNRDNHLVNFEKNHDVKIAKLSEKADDLVNLIGEAQKNAVNFAERDSIGNHSQYGKFNAFYRTKETFDAEKLLYSNYGAIVAEYDRGAASAIEANAENLDGKKKLLLKHEDDLAAIDEKYQEILARRASVVARKDVENAAYAAKVETIRQNHNLSEAGKHLALAEAKAGHENKLKSIKGALLALPSLKDIKNSKKEDILNINHAFKRDEKALKTNYTKEEHASYAAVNFMLLAYKFDYDFANRSIKEVAKHLSPQDAAQHLDSATKNEADYLARCPKKFDGQPKGFKRQMGSLTDDNFHLSLLTLPLIGVAIFVIMPLFLSILVAFTNYNHDHTPPTALFTWIGLGNFTTLFGLNSSSTVYVGLGAQLGGMILWTLVWAVLATFSNYFLGIIYALMINKEGIKFKSFWRFVFVLSIAVPQFISLIGISLLLKDNGAIGQLWTSIFGFKLGFASDTTNAALVSKIIIILVNIWVGVPYTILQTTGILLNVPKDLYESSKIDGATPATQFFKITMPYIFFVTGPSLIQAFIGNINNFNVIYFLTGGGPSNNSVSGGTLGYTDLLITFIYKIVTNTSHEEYGLASTIGIVVFAICAFISVVIYNKSSSVTKEDQFQ